MATRQRANRNPALRENIFKPDPTFSPDGSVQPYAATAEQMSVQGTARKALILLVIVFATASVPWGQVLAGEDVTTYFWGGIIGGLVLAMVTIFKPHLAPFTAPLYAGAEGFALGAISGFFQLAYPGIAIQAVLATLSVFLVMLFLYSTRTIRVTDKFRRGVIGATLAIMGLYLISMLLRLFGIDMPLLHDTGTLGILVSLGIIVVAALNLMLDFDFIERGAQEGAPKNLEWFGAFGLLVTLVWLYIEILRLLAILRED